MLYCRYVIWISSVIEPSSKEIHMNNPLYLRVNHGESQAISVNLSTMIHIPLVQPCADSTSDW